MNFVRNGDVTLALETRGHGPTTLLFAHGWISSRRMWYDVVDRLDPTRYTAHLLDFRGSGLSDRPMGGHDLDGYASDFRAALATLPGPVTVIAHSMGAKIAQFVATEAPPNLGRLLLIAPGSATAYRLDPKHLALATQAFGYRDRIERFQRGAMVRPVGAEAVERLVEDALIAQREHWFGWYERGRTADFAARLNLIRVPTVVLGGEGDPLASPSRLRREVVEAIPGALSVFLKSAGHNLPVETPDEVAALIDRTAGT